MNTGELVESGVSFPPYHPRCYCQLVAYIEDRYEPVEVIYGEEAKRDEYLKEFISSYTGHELGVKVREMMVRAKAQAILWSEKDYEDDFKDHWNKLGKSKDEMAKLTFDTIANAKYITMNAYRPKRAGVAPKIQMMFYAQLDKDFSNIAVVHLEGANIGKITGSWPGRDVDKTFTNKKGEQAWLKIKRE